MKYDPAPAVDAATVVLVRGGEPWECFMVLRHVRNEFAPAVYVFPGGKVDTADRDAALMEYVTAQFPPPGVEDVDSTGWRALQVAAVRELFEEAGVLLADDVPSTQAIAWRLELQRGHMTMLDLARESGLRYELAALHPLARWITPEDSPRRYDTRFFLARLPPGQDPAHDDLETTASCWISPDTALREMEAGRFPLVYPTIRMLQRLARYRSVDELLAAVSEDDLLPVMPRVVRAGPDPVIVLPGDPRYGDSTP